MRVCIALIAVAGGLGLACGEDKNYGDPIDDPNATASATAAVSNTNQLREDTANDTALNALNGLSANYNLMAGAKLQYEQGSQPQALPAVDDACVVVSESGVVYDDCDFAGNTVNGSVSRSGSDVSIDLEFFRSDTDTSTTIDVDGKVSITAASLSGYVDFGIRMQTDSITVNTSLDGDFDIDLVDGCAVGGELEVHASAHANGQSQSVWVKAEYGPECGDIVIR